MNHQPLTPEQMKIIFDRVNAILQHHNKILQDEVEQLRKEHIALHKFLPKWSRTMQRTMKLYVN